jgi:hypothetical protein
VRKSEPGKTLLSGKRLVDIFLSSMHAGYLVPCKMQPPIRRFIIPDDRCPKSQADNSYRLQPNLRMYGALPLLQQVLRDFDRNVSFACHNKFSALYQNVSQGLKKIISPAFFSSATDRSYVRETASDLCSTCVC